MSNRKIILALAKLELQLFQLKVQIEEEKFNLCQKLKFSTTSQTLERFENLCRVADPASSFEQELTKAFITTTLSTKTAQAATHVQAQSKLHQQYRVWQTSYYKFLYQPESFPEGALLKKLKEQCSILLKKAEVLEKRLQKEVNTPKVRSSKDLLS